MVKLLMLKTFIGESVRVIDDILYHAEQENL